MAKEDRSHYQKQHQTKCGFPEPKRTQWNGTLLYKEMEFCERRFWGANKMDHDGNRTDEPRPSWGIEQGSMFQDLVGV